MHKPQKVNCMFSSQPTSCTSPSMSVWLPGRSTSHQLPLWERRSQSCRMKVWHIQKSMDFNKVDWKSTSLNLSAIKQQSLVVLSVPCYFSIKNQICQELSDYRGHLGPFKWLQPLNFGLILCRISTIYHLGGSLVPYSTMMPPSP